MGSKHDLPKGCQWPVKISAIVADVKAYRPQLEVRFSTFGNQAYRQQGAKTDEGRRHHIYFRLPLLA